MTTISQLRASAAFAALLAASERMGRDPLQVQGPGGNTSLKRDGLMLVKASGTWLAEAREREIMVAVRSGALRAALLAGDPAAETASGFALDETPGLRPSIETQGLRPSIETTVHAALDWPVVIHTHCIATISAAAQADCAERTRRTLGDLGAVALPYVKPGVPLARAILSRAGPATRVLVLGNHGLVVCGETVADAEALAGEVARRLHTDPAPGAAPASGFAEALGGTGWIPAPHPLTQALARDPARLALADGGSLYPDHVVFLGPGVRVARADESPADAVARAETPRRKLVLVPGRGAAVPADASPSVLAMARALGDVCARIPPDAAVVRLTPAQEADLLDWDAEKHRQALEAQRSAR